jgi:hypothetical protein
MFASCSWLVSFLFQRFITLLMRHERSQADLAFAAWFLGGLACYGY